jgi:hypothetical protein
MRTLSSLQKLQRERRQQLIEKENRLMRTLNTIRENSARALQLLGAVATLHEALLLANTDICAELESANPHSACTRKAISVLSKATDSVQMSNESLKVWNLAIQQLLEAQKIAYHTNVAAAHATNQALDELTAMTPPELQTYEHMEPHLLCAHCNSTLNLQRAVGFGTCTSCTQVSWDESWQGLLN